MGSFAEYEKKLLVLRLRGGRIAKHRRGGYAGGRTIPYGLQVQGEGSDAVLVADEDEAPAVQMIYQQRAAGQTFRGIADKLNDQGIPTQRGNEWAAQTVKNVLTNPLYVVTGILTQEQFDAGQQRGGDEQ